MLILFWLIFFGFILQSIAAKYGVPYLFLNPEYLGNVDFLSYLIVGFACGGFIMAFNISSYIMNAFRFPFLATLSNPFFKFCLNNSILPVSFMITYSVAIFNFQTTNQFETKADAALDVLGYLLGNTLFFIISLSYFRTVNKDLYKMFGFENREHLNEPINKGVRSKPLYMIKRDARDWYVDTYVSNFFQLKLARRYDHYKKEMLIQVFKQNHFNASVFEIIAVVSLLALGLFKNVPVFELPAGASVFLLFTMVLMLTSAIHTWLRGWSSTVSIILLVILNGVYGYSVVNYRNKAYGLNYRTERADYSNYALNEYDKQKIYHEKDMLHTIEMLNKWRLKNSKNSLEMKKKPKFVILNASGGGLRSALWTFLSMQYSDSLLDGQFLNHLGYISGSSGGMIGAAYMRELYLRKKQGSLPSIYSTEYLDNISKDVLNPIAFSIATTDMFFKLRTFKDGEYEYVEDRGYAFECKLNENTFNLMNKRLRDYFEYEADATIPMMVFAPTMVNDGRKMIISSQPVSYLVQNDYADKLKKHDVHNAIEFSRFFERQDAGNLKFTSALRMNATFPYVMPAVTLPSDPVIEVTDAGMRDNYGFETALRFVYEFRNWLSTNTSGVVIVQTRADRPKISPIDETPTRSLVGSLTAPVGSVYDNIFDVQDYNHDELLQFASTWFDNKIDVIDLQLRNEKPDKISLSWHLTKKEKKKVLESIDLPENQSAIQKLKRLLE